MSAGISSPPRPANEAQNIHPRRPRLQKRGGCARDVRHNRWKDRGYRVGMIEKFSQKCFIRETLNNSY